MINKEEFEFHKSIVDWMGEKGIPFLEAMAVVSFAHQSDKTIAKAYLEVISPYKVKSNEEENIT